MNFAGRQGLKKCSSQLILKNVPSVSVATVPLTVDEAKQIDYRVAKAKPFNEMPKIPSFPFIGSAWVYFPIVGRYDALRLHRADQHKNEVYGDVVREQIGHLSVVSSFRPEDMQTLMTHEGKYPSRGEMSTLKTYRESRKQWYNTTGVILLQGKEWYDLRSKVQPHLMKPKNIHAYLDPMQEVAKDLSARINLIKNKDNEVPNLVEELYKWSLESVAYVGLDTRLGCLWNDLSPDSDAVKMIQSVNTIFSTMNKLEAVNGNIQFWKYFSTPTWRKFTNASDVFSEIAYKYINRSLENLKNNNEEKELTMLQVMLATKGLDVSGAMVTVSDMLMAGIDTTSHTVGFALYRLARNPEKQEKLYQDLLRIFPSKSDKVTTTTFNELRYLKMCLKETIRMDPIVRANVRLLDHDVALSGYRVPAGTMIQVIQQQISRSEKHFKDPLKFIPERWSEKDRKRHPFAYLPFGFGPRSCLGRRLAELEVICLIAEIVRNYRLEYHHEDIDMYTRLVNTPDKDLLIRFITR